MPPDKNDMYASYIKRMKGRPWFAVLKKVVSSIYKYKHLVDLYFIGVFEQLAYNLQQSFVENVKVVESLHGRKSSEQLQIGSQVPHTTSIHLLVCWSRSATPYKECQALLL